MKKLVWLALLASALSAAPPDPVSWKVVESPARPVKAGARFTLKLAAEIQPGWHMYSMKAVEDGPIPTRLWLAEGQPFQSGGPVQASHPEVRQDPGFGMEVGIYEGQATFAVPVRAAASAAAGAQRLVVNASYQTCDNKLCLPPKTVKVEVPVTIGR